MEACYSNQGDSHYKEYCEDADKYGYFDAVA